VERSTAAGGCRENEGKLPETQGFDRFPAECGAGREVPRAGRRVLRLAQRHRGLPHVGAKDSEDFRQRLLNEAGVAVLADIHFGAPRARRRQHVRFSYAASISDRGGRRAHGDFIRKNTRKAA